MGAKVSVKVSGGEIRGKVKKINTNGRSIIRLSNALGESVELGSIQVAVINRGPEDKLVQVLGSGGGSYWTGSGYLVGYEAKEASGKVDANLEFSSGIIKLSGWPAYEHAKFGVGNKAYEVNTGPDF